MSACCTRIGTMNLGSKIDRLMGKRRIATQRDLARLANVTKSSLGRWINGEGCPPLDEAARLAKVLETSLDYLVSESDEDIRTEADLTDDEKVLIVVYRDLKLTRPEAVRRLTGHPAKCEKVEKDENDEKPAQSQGGPMKVIGERDLSHLRRDEEAKGNEKGKEKDGGPSPRRSN
jgi:transcriptional regulator with XRE-family HTH domain